MLGELTHKAKAPLSLIGPGGALTLAVEFLDLRDSLEMLDQFINAGLFLGLASLGFGGSALFLTYSTVRAEQAVATMQAGGADTAIELSASSDKIKEAAKHLLYTAYASTIGLFSLLYFDGFGDQGALAAEALGIADGLTEIIGSPWFDELCEGIVGTGLLSVSAMYMISSLHKILSELKKPS